MVSVKVYSKSTGKPVTRTYVKIWFEGFSRGASAEEVTDDEGNADFDNDPGQGYVYVSGQECYRGYISGRTVVYC